MTVLAILAALTGVWYVARRDWIDAGTGALLACSLTVALVALGGVFALLHAAGFLKGGPIPEARQIATVNQSDIRGLPARGQAEHA